MKAFCTVFNILKNMTSPPFHNSFHRLWLLFKEQSSALLPTADILNYTFPFIQSSKGKGRIVA